MQDHVFREPFDWLILAGTLWASDNRVDHLQQHLFILLENLHKCVSKINHDCMKYLRVVHLN